MVVEAVKVTVGGVLEGFVRERLLGDFLEFALAL